MEASQCPAEWSLLGDVNNDGIVNLGDLGPMAQGWLGAETEAWGDLNLDGTVDGVDLALLQAEWRTETGWRTWWRWRGCG